jgi:hypothetical protein
VGGARYCAVAAGIMCCVLQHEEFFFWVAGSAMGILYLRWGQI